MESTEGGATPGETPVEIAIQQYLDSVEAGNSRKNFQSTLATWKDWLREERVTRVQVCSASRTGCIGARTVQDGPRAADRRLAGLPPGHAPSKCGAVREQLANEGIPEDEIEAILDRTDVETVLRDRDVVPPALSTKGARNLMQRLCETADIDVEGDYLKPHGARRGLGHELYASGHAELAQSALRHASIETTHESYSDIQAAETAQQVDDLLEK